jgi:hypothetical protein
MSGCTIYASRKQLPGKFANFMTSPEFGQLLGRKPVAEKWPVFVQVKGFQTLNATNKRGFGKKMPLFSQNSYCFSMEISSTSKISTDPPGIGPVLLSP